MANKRDADAFIHETARRCARRCLAIIAPLLRQEEMREAMREFSDAITDELARNRAGGTDGLVPPQPRD